MPALWLRRFFTTGWRNVLAMGKINIAIAVMLFLSGIAASSGYLMMSSGGDDAPAPSMDAVIPDSSQPSSRTSVSNSPDQASASAGNGAMDPVQESTFPSAEQESETIFKGSQSHLEYRQRGDRYLVAGSYALALDYYHRADPIDDKRASESLLRKAFCHESLQRFAVAGRIFRQTALDTANENHLLLATAGMARCLLAQQRSREAIEVLSDLMLKLDRYPDAPKETISELVYAFAMAVDARSLTYDDDLLANKGVTRAKATPRPEKVLASIDAALPEHDRFHQSETATIFQIEQKPSTSLNVITATVVTELSPVLVTLAEVISAADLELFVSDNARSTLAKRSREVNLRSVPLSATFDRLLIPFDLVWYQTEDKVYIVKRAELRSSTQTNNDVAELALRNYRRFELTFPDDDRKQSSLLARANIQLIRGEFDKAGNRFQELEQSSPTGELKAKMFFNQAKLAILQKRSEDAIGLLYLAVDQTDDPDLESSGYCLLGASQIGLGQLEPSIQSSNRGLAIAVEDRQRRYAALSLARAYLLINDPFSANRVLFDNRTAFENPQTDAANKDAKTEAATEKATAALLGSYSRFLGTGDEHNGNVARSRMLNSVSMMDDDSLQTFADCYFAAQAFGQAGFENEAIKLLMKAVGREDVGVWQRQLFYELATRYRASEQPDKAIEVLKTLADEAASDQWNRLSLHQLAEIYEQNGDAGQCIDMCRRLWKLELTAEQKRSVLQMLGSSYRVQGKNHAAALCFAGYLPGDFE